MKSDWIKLPFEDVVSDETGGNVKTQQADFQTEGRYPIIDQGKALIAGYTDDQTRLCKARLPVIVFGDHTRSLKFIDFPFCLGADGTKILRARVDADPKYLFHYLRQIRIPDAGYDRHFKYLKRADIWLPPLDEQRRIAVILDQIDDLRRKRRRTLERLSDLDDALFVDFFGDPRRNSYHPVKFSDICERITVGIVVKPASYYQDSGVPALRSMNIGKNEFNLDSLVYFSKKDNETKLSKTRVFTGDVVAVRTGQPGKAAVIPDELHGVNAIDLLLMTPNKDKVQPLYLCSFLNSAAGKRMVLSCQRGQIQQHLNVGSLSAALIPLPPIPLQLEFLEASKAANELKNCYRAHLTELDTLFASLQHRAFSGELIPRPAELPMAG